MNSARATQPVYITGAFDNLGSEHMRFLDEAARLGPVTVLLWSDAFIRQQTGNAPKFPENERFYLLQSIRYVNQTKLVHDEAELARFLTAPEIKTSALVLSESDSDAKTLCDRQHIPYRVLRDEDLRQFPGHTPHPSSASSTRKKVIVTGCYDWLHSGHVRFFEEVSAFGDLYVIVGHDANIRLLKGEGRPLFPESQRRYLVGSIRYVHEALVSTGHGWLDAEPEIVRLKPAIYAVNEDGDRPEKRDYCARQDIQYLVLKRTPAPGLPARSSTELRGGK